MRIRITFIAVGALVLAMLAQTQSFAAPGDIDNLVPSGYYNTPCTQIMAGAWSIASVCQTDNASLNYYMDSNGQYELEAGDRAAVQTALINQYAPTDLSVGYDSSPTFSGAGETDIVFQEGDDVPQGYAGITWCDDRVDGSTYACDQQFVRIRGGGYYNSIRACHETGHAVGLLHGSDSSPLVGDLDSRLGCMRTPTSSISDWELGANQVWQINNRY